MILQTLSLLLLVNAQDAEDLQRSRALNESLFWGTYRPNLYFGTRTRTPETLLTGLMWFGLKDLQSKPWENVRHTCEHDDNISGYAWQKHDGRTYGTQSTTDHLNNVIIKTEFIKSPGGDNGGDWYRVAKNRAVRITGTPIDKNIPLTLSLLFYANLDGEGELDSDDGEHLHISGTTKELGNFKIFVNEGSNNLT